ncbi:MAG: hypothetical protein KDA37_04315 [Planctomycetales bacterium]|nr:hypothetical protein [Planctomycetales bacterium]
MLISSLVSFWRYPLAWLALVATSWAADYSSLVAKLPDTSNAMILLDAKGLFDSPYGKEHNWKGQHASKFRSDPSMIPPTTELFAWGAELHLQTLTPTQQYAVMSLWQDLSMPALGKWLRGSLQTIGGFEAVGARRGAMVLKFSPEQYGMIVPGDRQRTARWVREIKGESGASLPPYLQSAVAEATGARAHICQAIDLTDAVDYSRVRQAMAKSKVVSGAGLDASRVADLLTGIRGVTVLVNVDDRMHGKLQVDFTGSPSILGDSAKPLVLEVLNESGASLDELDGWSAETGARRIELSGELTESGLMRLMSFLEVDTAVVDQGDQAADDEEGSEASPSSTATVTRDYYQGVQKYLRDLKHEHGARSYYSIATWFDKYARRISRLPILNVDPEMLDYSEAVIAHLRDAADSIQSGGVNAGTRSAQLSRGGSGYYDSYNGYSTFSGGVTYTNNVEAERRAIRAQERGQSSLDVKGHIAAIEAATLRVRRAMTDKYNMEF